MENGFYESFIGFLFLWGLWEWSKKKKQNNTENNSGNNNLIKTKILDYLTYILYIILGIALLILCIVIFMHVFNI